MVDREDIKRTMRDFYARVAADPSIVCPLGDAAVIAQATTLGYEEEEIKRLPKGCLAGLGCGNPLSFAELKEGEIVLDLGSGAGKDVFLAAHRVGKKGHVVGVDMTPEMNAKAEAAAREGSCHNVEFRLAELESLPVQDGTVDCIISNCVINHSPDPGAVFREGFRVLRPGGRMAVCDLVTDRELSSEVRRSLEGPSAWIAAALETDRYLDAIKQAGFREVTILGQSPFSWEGMPGELAGRVSSVQVKALK